MKKTITLITLVTTLCVATLPACGRKAAEAEPVSTGDNVSALVREFSSKPDFEVVEFGRLGVSIVKALIRESKDEDAAMLIDAIDKVKRVIITNYDECDEVVKKEFVSRLKGLLDEEALLFEARESGNKLQVYGQSSEDGSSIKDLLINIPGQGTLVTIKGIIPMDKVSEIAGKAMR